MKDFKINGQRERQRISMCCYKNGKQLKSTLSHCSHCNVPNGFSMGTDIVADEPIMHSISSKTTASAAVAVKFRIYQNWPIVGFEKLILPLKAPECKGE